MLVRYITMTSREPLPGAGMTVYMYHGKGRGVKPQQLARYNCVLTTYTSMSMEAAPKADAKQGTNLLQAIDLDEELKPSGEPWHCPCSSLPHVPLFAC